jgi:HAD superfamily hydrolase (TIGR01662 family)
MIDAAPGQSAMRTPRGLLVDYGGTLVEELSVDPRAGNAWLLAHASYRPPHVTLEQVMERAALVAREAVARRDHVQLETAWPTLMRLIHDFFGIRFDRTVEELEIGFWDASMRTVPLPGAREALAQLHAKGVPIGVVSNTSFSERAIQHELAKHGLTEHLAFVMVSSAYAVRKPNVLLYDTAAARLGVAPADIWFVGDRLDTDVAGANAAGMAAVWLRPRQTRELPSPAADLVVSNWSELIGSVEAAAAEVV